MPLHYLTCAVFLVLTQKDLSLVPDFWMQGATHLLVVHNLFLTHWGSINGVNWSIGTELDFIELRGIGEGILGAFP